MTMFVTSNSQVKNQELNEDKGNCMGEETTSTADIPKLFHNYTQQQVVEIQTYHPYEYPVRHMHRAESKKIENLAATGDNYLKRYVNKSPRLMRHLLNFQIVYNKQFILANREYRYSAKSGVETKARNLFSVPDAGHFLRSPPISLPASAQRRKDLPQGISSLLDQKLPILMKFIMHSQLPAILEILWSPRTTSGTLKIAQRHYQLQVGAIFRFAQIHKISVPAGLIPSLPANCFSAPQNQRYRHAYCPYFQI